MTPELKQRLQSCSALPTMSAVALELLRRSKDDSLGYPEIARYVSRDPALAVRVLKTANSPLFGLRHPVQTITQALNLLGLNTLRMLVLSFSLVRDCAQERSGPLAASWKRSVIASIAARELCAAKAGCDREEALLAGLLQDIGVFALSKAFGNKYDSVCGTNLSHDARRAAEIGEFGADHAEIGAWLLEHLGMPQDLVKMVRHSHDSKSLTEGDRLPFMARCVEFSGRLADLVLAHDAGSVMPLIEAEATVLFGEAQLDLSNLLSAVVSGVQQVAPMFEIRMDDAEIASIQEQAQEAVAASAVRLEAATKELRDTTQRDALTGLHNRAFLDAFVSSAPATEPLGILFIDIDHFKSINDRFGHGTGDQVLRSVAQRIAQCGHSSDVICRYGGEEFVSILRLNGSEDISAVAERMRKSVEHPPHPIDSNQTLPVTVSIGCAAGPKEGSGPLQESIKEADMALYSAKAAGRNRVICRPAAGNADGTTNGPAAG